MYGAADHRMGVSAVSREEHPSARGQFDQTISRGLNLVLAVLALLLFLPLMLIIGAAVYIANPGPIFYAQNRIGYGGRLFRCLKFRTMATDSEARLRHLLETDPVARAEWQRDHKLSSPHRVVRVDS